MSADPAEVVAWFGAMQSQDYGGAQWGVAARSDALTRHDLDQAFANGTILRTHVMRPTWHFVSSRDIGWMLQLTSPRVRKLSSYYFTKLDLDDATFAKAHRVFIKALEGKAYKTRSELGATLQQAGIDTSDLLRLTYLVGEAELEGIICSGPSRGKQQTYALLAERAPNALNLSHEEALSELALRFFRSHGPATLADYAWWSGLSKADARFGLSSASSQLTHDVIEGREYWFAPETPAHAPAASCYLLPNYDEYVVAYTDRSALFDAAEHKALLDSRQNPLFNNVVIVDGVVLGTWKRTVRATAIAVELNLFRPLDKTHRALLQKSLDRYSHFMGAPVLLDN